VDGQTSSPALAGSYTVNGIECKTAYQLLKERAAEYTLEKVQEITSVPPADVQELAHMLGTIKPAMIGFGWGIDQSLYGSEAARVGSILAVLTDNWGKPGAGIGFHSHATGFRDITPCWGASLPGGMVALPATAKAVTDPKIPIHVALIARDPMNNRLCDLNFYKQFVKGLDFSVNVEQYFGTTTLWCDMVLPACTFMESPTDLVSLISARNGLLLQQKVVPPMWESKPDWQIEKELAERLGFGDYYKHTPDTQIRDQLAGAKDPEFQGITLDKLLAAGGALPINVPSTPNISRERFREAEKFPTDSGRAELYNEKLLPLGQELPVYKDDYEASPTHPLAKKYPLVFTTRHHVQRCHSQFFDSAWLLEIWPEPFLEMNPVDAAARGLKTGDYAEAFNDRGRAVARVVVTSDYPPGQCNIHHGWKQQQYKAGHHQELTNPRINPAHVLMGYAGNLSFQDNRVEVRKVSM
jgi:molybdopterin-containing oxidoreductase family molybdopterin binding subunit